MPTQKPRVTFAVSSERLGEITKFGKTAGCKNLSQAILTLIDRGLSDMEQEPVLLSARSVLCEDLVKMFDQLNEEGQEKLVSYADDLVSSGKYIKTHTFGLVDDQA